MWLYLALKKTYSASTMLVTRTGVVFSVVHEMSSWYSFFELLRKSNYILSKWITLSLNSMITA